MPEDYKVILTASQLHDRREAITQMLHPLLPGQNSLYISSSVKSSDEFHWMANPLRAKLQSSRKRKRTPKQLELEQEREDTEQELIARSNTEDKKFLTMRGVYASYREIWKRFYSDKNEYWYMESAYLHFYQIDKDAEEYKEYLLLHCDPNESREHKIYKQSPHLHLEFAPYPWNKAHIALNIGYLEPMLADASSLTNVFGGAIIMLKDQILQHL